MSVRLRVLGHSGVALECTSYRIVRNWDATFRQKFSELTKKRKLGRTRAS